MALSRTNTDSFTHDLLGLAPKFKLAPKAESIHDKHDEAKIAFNKFVDARYKDGSSGYSEVGVLLVCWSDDDLGVADEVSGQPAKASYMC